MSTHLKEIAMLRAAVLFALLASIDVDANACDVHPVWTDPAVLKAQQELLTAYERALENSNRHEFLLASQQAWEDYREANCALMSDRDGATAYAALSQCIAFMARERTFELRLLSY
jgi:uncharacterized protein YecT (DUF1311 family)